MATWAGWVDAYNGPDYDTMKERLGDMALTDSVTRVRVWRDGALYRSLEVTV